MFRFGVKAAVAGGAVYYLNSEGVWKSSEESVQLYNKVGALLGPHWEQLKQQYNFEPFKLPDFDEPYTQAAKSSYNRAVMYTFKLLSGLPSDVTRWSHEGYNTLINHPEVKRLLNNSPLMENKLSNKSAG